MVSADSTGLLRNFYNLVFLSFLLLLLFLGSQFSSELLNVGLLLSIPSRFSSLAAAQSPRHPIFVDPALFHIHCHIKLIDSTSVTSRIRYLSRSLFIKLDESVALRFSCFGICDYTDAPDLAEGFELSA